MTEVYRGRIEEEEGGGAVPAAMQEQTPLFDGPAGGSNRCRECRRPLSNPKSRERGLGPVCAARVGVGGSAEEGGYADGFIHDVPIRVKVVLERRDGRVFTNVPKAVVHHSPTGFEWGYGGSGPADLALNICEIAVAHVVPKTDHSAVELYQGRCSAEAWSLHQDFKAEFLGDLPAEGGEIPWERVAEWVRARTTDGGRS